MPVLKNSRHEIVAQERFKGKSLQEAMEKAGYSPKWARSAGCRLLSTKVNILDRIEELHKATASPAIMDIKRRKERLTHIAEEDNEGKFGFQRQPNISAIAEINKMEGEYPPSKLEVEPGEKLSEALTELLERLRGNKG